MKKAKVIVSIQETILPESVLPQLQAIGFELTEHLSNIGVLLGSAYVDNLNILQNIPGVISVQLDADYFVVDLK